MRLWCKKIEFYLISFLLLFGIWWYYSCLVWMYARILIWFVFYEKQMSQSVSDNLMATWQVYMILLYTWFDGHYSLLLRTKTIPSFFCNHLYLYRLNLNWNWKSESEFLAPLHFNQMFPVEWSLFKKKCDIRRNICACCLLIKFNNESWRSPGCTILLLSPYWQRQRSTYKNDMIKEIKFRNSKKFNTLSSNAKLKRTFISI